MERESNASAGAWAWSRCRPGRAVVEPAQECKHAQIAHLFRSESVCACVQFFPAHRARDSGCGGTARPVQGIRCHSLLGHSLHCHPLVSPRCGCTHTHDASKDVKTNITWTLIADTLFVIVPAGHTALTGPCTGRHRSCSPRVWRPAVPLCRLCCPHLTLASTTSFRRRCHRRSRACPPRPLAARSHPRRIWIGVACRRTRCSRPRSCTTCRPNSSMSSRDNDTNPHSQPQRDGSVTALKMDRRAARTPTRRLLAGDSC